MCCGSMCGGQPTLHNASIVELCAPRYESPFKTLNTTLHLPSDYTVLHVPHPASLYVYQTLCYCACFCRSFHDLCCISDYPRVKSYKIYRNQIYTLNITLILLLSFKSYLGYLKGK